MQCGGTTRLTGYCVSMQSIGRLHICVSKRTAPSPHQLASHLPRILYTMPLLMNPTRPSTRTTPTWRQETPDGWRSSVFSCRYTARGWNHAFLKFSLSRIPVGCGVCVESVDFGNGAVLAVFAIFAAHEPATGFIIVQLRMRLRYLYQDIVAAAPSASDCRAAIRRIRSVGRITCTYVHLCATVSQYDA